MNKIKLNAGLASVILVACLFAGWSTLLTVAVLMFLFCDLDDRVKGVATKVIAFYIGYTLLSQAWGFIYDGIGLLLSELSNIVRFINDLFNASLDLTKIYDILNPIYDLCGIADRIFVFFLAVIKFMFIVNVFSNKPMKENIIVKYINNFVAKVVTYINSIDFTAPVAPVTPVAPEAPVQQ